MAVIFTRIDKDILHIVIDNPPVNALSLAVRAGLVDALSLAEADAIRGVVLSCVGRTFIAGADIREMNMPPAPPHLPDVLAMLEACPKPVVAAIQGQALGGGLEAALACHYRVATHDARMGLPETTLGIVPGAGGTQRLPRLIDPIEAGRLVAGGKPIAATQAFELGLVDRLADDSVTAAVAIIEECRGENLDNRRLSRRAPAMVADWSAVEREVARQSRGAEAPGAALTLVKLAGERDFAEGMAAERETFLCLRQGEEAAALRHIFFAERAAAKGGGLEGVAARPVTCVGIIGAGTMGAGIAMTFADAGFAVTLMDVSAQALGRGLERIHSAYADAARRGRITEVAAAERAGGISGAADYAALAECDLIIEAAYESLDVKREIFVALDRVARPGAILATNTSYLDIDVIAAATSRRGDVVGLHYFAPANVMRLLEIVRATETAPDVLTTSLAVAKRIGKIAVIAGLCSGFIGNRMLRAYVREAGLLLLEGASAEAVDAALTGFGMAMGPFAVADLSGIDIGWRARKEMPEGSYEPLATYVHDRLVERGDLGRKSGAGFYSYATDGARRANPVVASLAEEARGVAGIAAGNVTAEEIVERCLLALANEGFHILDEGVAARSGDIDTVYVHGYGFPRHRGGPMFWAERRGHLALLDAIRRREQGRFGRWWRPAPLLERLAATDA